MSRKKTFEEFLTEARKKHGDKFTYDETTYVNTNTVMRIICPKHGEFFTTPKSHLLYDCEKCSYEERGKKYLKKHAEKFIEKAKKVHGDKYDYSLVEYKGAKIPVTIICPQHGCFLQTPMDHLQNKGCQKCKISHLEKEVEKILQEKKIEYVSQYKTIFLGKQSLDFYIPSKNIAIECQGKQHFGKGGWVNNFNFKKLYQLDEKKFNLCKENGIDIIYVIDKNITIPNNLYFYKNKTIIIDNFKTLFS